MHYALGGDHRRVIRTVPFFGQNERKRVLFASRLQATAQISVRRYAAARRHRVHAPFERRRDRLFNEYVYRRALKGRRHVRFLVRFALLFLRMTIIDDRRFQSAVREVIPPAAFEHFRHRDIRVPVRRATLDIRAAGVFKTEYPRYFVERLADGVVEGRAEYFELGLRFRMQDRRMTAACEQRR